MKPRSIVKKRTSKTPIKVLIAEDDPVSIKILEKRLHQWGYRTLLARNGNEAWRALQKPGLRVALLDWMMPKVAGVELCRRIRQISKPNYTYIILLTSKDQTGDVIKGLQAGADDYMTKPVNFLELHARLQTGRRIIQLEDHLLETQQRLYELSTRDNLTALWNRATILRFLEEELEQGAREKSPTSAIMLDVDEFKMINDSHGHLAGDSVLRSIADSLTGKVRIYDKIGRYGGDEFLVVHPNCTLKNVMKIAERLRAACAKKKIRVPGGRISVTLSLGCASSESRDRLSVDRLIWDCDRALYQAKRWGRNRVAGPNHAPESRKGTSHGKKTK
jgi:two-component system cell cycle response regulator